MSMFDYIGHAFRTITGFYLKPFSEEWDLKLNDIIDRGDIIECSEYTIDFIYRDAVISVWIENKWYSFGYENSINGGRVPVEMQFRPRFKTMKRLWEVYAPNRHNRIAECYQALHERKIDKFAIRRFGE